MITREMLTEVLKIAAVIMLIVFAAYLLLDKGGSFLEPINSINDVNIFGG